MQPDSTEQTPDDECEPLSAPHQYRMKHLRSPLRHIPPPSSLQKIWPWPFRLTSDGDPGVLTSIIPIVFSLVTPVQPLRKKVIMHTISWDYLPLDFHQLIGMPG